MGLMLLGVLVRGIVVWAWDNAQPVISTRARAVSKWTTTSGGGKGPAVTHYHARFETADGALDFEVSLGVYQQFGEGDTGTLVYQGSHVRGFHRA
jgi:hypothetical protein